MQNVKRLISVAIIFTLFMLIILYMATKAVKATEKGICTIECINNTNYTYTFNIEWIDHPYKRQTRGKPWSIAMGEINPNKSWKLTEYGYLPGLYKVECYPTAYAPLNNPNMRASTELIIKPYVSKITITTLIIEDKLELFLIYGYGL